MSAPHPTKRGEEKPRGAVTIAIILVGLVFVGILVFLITAFSTKTTVTVLSQQKEYELTSTSVVKGLFAVGAIKYADTDNASCALGDSFSRPASLVLRMKPYEVPESCSIFVDSTLIKTERRLEPDCREACTFKEFDRGISIGLVDYRDDHTIRVCCNSICVEEILPSLCGEQTAAPLTAEPVQNRQTLYIALGGGIGIILFVAIVLIAQHHQQKL